MAYTSLERKTKSLKETNTKLINPKTDICMYDDDTIRQHIKATAYQTTPNIYLSAHSFIVVRDRANKHRQLATQFHTWLSSSSWGSADTEAMHAKSPTRDCVTTENGAG